MAYNMEDPIMSLDARYKICKSCRGNFPASYFGAYRYEKDNISSECKECHSQRFRLLRKNKYNAKSTKDDSVIRNLRTHNKTIIHQAILLPHLDLYALNYDSKEIYTISISSQAQPGAYKLTITFPSKNDGRTYLFYPNDPGQLDFVIDLLKTLNLRLEKSEADCTVSKRYIYIF